MIHLNFKNVVWDKTPNGIAIPRTARYCCQECGVLLDDYQIKSNLIKGEWIPTAAFDGVAGFHDFPEMYSPWRKMNQTVSDFVHAKEDDDILRVWVNTALGQYWEKKGDIVNANENI